MTLEFGTDAQIRWLCTHAAQSRSPSPPANNRQEHSGPAFPITLGDYGWSAAVTRDPPFGVAVDEPTWSGRTARYWLIWLAEPRRRGSLWMAIAVRQLFGPGICRACAGGDTARSGNEALTRGGSPDADAEFAESRGDVVDPGTGRPVVRQREARFAAPEHVAEGLADVPGHDPLCG